MATKTQTAQRNLGFTLNANTFSRTGYDFGGWNTSADGSGTSYSDGQENVSFSNNTTLYAQWAISQYTLTLVVSPAGGGTVTGGGTVNYGTSRTVTATPASGYDFVSWSDGGNQSHNVTVNSNTTLTATFARQSERVNFYAFESSPTPYSTTYVPETGATIADKAPDPSVFGMTGWTFSNWRKDTAYGPENVASTDQLEKGTNYYAYWTVEYKNLVFQTPDDDPNSSVADADLSTLVSGKSYVAVYDIATSAQLALPTGATIGIAECIGLLQHDGNATSHYLTYMPAVATDELAGTKAIHSDTTANISESISAVWHSTSATYNPSKKKWEYGNADKDLTTRLKINMGKSDPPQGMQCALSAEKTGSTWNYKDGWGIYAPLSHYNYPHYFDQYNLSDETTGQLIPTSTWDLKGGRFYAPWSITYAKSIHTFTASTTNKSADYTFIQVEVDDYCYENRGQLYPIPQTLPDGSRPSKLVMVLAKQTNGCTVKWRMFMHKMVLDLR